MKLSIQIAVFITLLLLGCSNQESSTAYPVSPEMENLTKPKTLTSIRCLLSELEAGSAQATKIIDGRNGDSIHLKQFAPDSSGRMIEVDACFNVLPGAFNGVRKITMTFNANTGCVSFVPSMAFNKSCQLDYRISNCDLAKLGFDPDDKKAYFVYFAEDGSIEPIDNSLVIMKWDNG